MKRPLKFLFLCCNTTLGHAVESIEIAKKLQEKSRDCEIYFVCDGHAAKMIEQQGFAVITHPLSGAFHKKYKGNTDFDGYLDVFMNGITDIILPDVVVSNFRYSFESCTRNNIPTVSIFCQDRLNQIKYVMSRSRKVFLTFSTEKNHILGENDNSEVVGPILPILPDSEIMKTEKRKLCPSGEKLIILSLGGGGWDTELKKILSVIIPELKKFRKYKYFIILPDNLIEFCNRLIKKDFRFITKNIIPPKEFVSLMKLSDFGIFHGGNTTMQAVALVLPFISIPLYFLEDQMKRASKFEKQGCCINLPNNKLSRKTFHGAFLRLTKNSEIIRKKQKKIPYSRAADKISDYLLEIAEEIRKKKGTFNFKTLKNFSYISNGNSSILFSERKNQTILIGWNYSSGNNSQNILPDWFSKILPYKIKKELGLRDFESEMFKKKLVITKTKDLVKNGHTLKSYSGLIDKRKISSFLWYCSQTKTEYALVQLDKIENIIDNFSCH